MGKIAYFDCFSGASGDMVLGALLDVGLPIEELRAALGSLAIEYGAVSSTRVLRAGVSATKFLATAANAAHVPEPVHAHAAHGHAHDPHHHDHGSHSHDHHHPHADDGDHRHAAHGHHSLKEIAAAIERSALTRHAKDRAIHLFERLGAAEAAIHETPLDRVHLHEVGALDSIIDVVGAVYGLEWLGVDEFAASALNVGGGTVDCAHGTFPVPAPATARLLRGAPVYAGPIASELVTPTGALLVTDYATTFGPLPSMRMDAIGYGAGDRDFTGHPNVLRLLVGTRESARSTDRVLMMSCEIDDMNPQLFGPLIDRLLGVGALDVFYAPVQMKKNRPGILVTIVAPPDRREPIAAVLFADTTTIGVRYQEVERECLDREIRIIETPVGPIRFKLAARDGRVLNASPEFDDCARAAAERGIPIKEVQALAVKAWLDSRN